jgi:3',5'-cyclic AMP phosphodiesterase CpdA
MSAQRLTRFAILAALVAGCAVPSQTAPHASATQSARPATPAAPTARVQPNSPAAAASAVNAPTSESSVRFAVLGDTGTGDRAQYQVGEQLAKARAIFPFEFVIMLGDNMYGSERPQDYQRKFELPYKAILDANIPFYASLGNHDDPNQRFYKPFNMNGERYYSFKKDKLGNPGVRFFALDSNYMTRDQLAWLEKELAASDSPWKIAFFHHPIYSSGERHGSEVDLRAQVEPLFIKYGMTVVFAGHEHFYERLHPQKGVYYFTAGGSAKLRVGNIAKTAMTARGFDSDNTYMLVEIAGDQMHFQTLTRSGKRIDSGTITRPSQTSQ